MAGFNPYNSGAWTPGGPLQQQYFSPYQYPQQSMPPGYTYSGTGSHLQSGPRSNILRVTGPESAKAYPMSPGDKVVLFDENEAVFYHLSADDSGFKSMRTFEFSEKAPDVIEVPPQTDAVESPDLATKEDLGSIEKEISEIKKMLKEFEGLVS